MSDIYFTSDTHFGHKNIIEICKRPFGQNIDLVDAVFDMDESLIRLWNEHVRPNDIVYHLGDVSFHKKEKTKEIVKRLNGQKYLVLGNHDYAMANVLIDGAGMFREIFHYKELKWNHQKICLFHFPIQAWHKAHQVSWHLHGHSHGSCPPLGKRLDVGVDCNGFRPIRIDLIKEYMDAREFVPGDYHGVDL